MQKGIAAGAAPTVERREHAGVSSEFSWNIPTPTLRKN
jgi:hypothetical protein